MKALLSIVALVSALLAFAQVDRGPGAVDSMGGKVHIRIQSGDLPPKPAVVLPALPSPTIGGIQALGSTARCFLTQISTNGTPTCDHLLTSDLPLLVNLNTNVAGGPVNAVVYGLLTTNSAATNATRLRQAITYGVTNIVFGPGDYHFDLSSGPIVIMHPMEVSGAGMSLTRLIGNSASSDFFSVNASAHFRDLAISSNVAQATGFAFSSTSSFGASWQRLKIYYCGGINTFNAQSPLIEDVYISVTCAGTGKGIVADGNGTGLNMYLTRGAVVGNSGAEPKAGLYVGVYDGIIATDWQADATGAGIDFGPSASAIHFFGKSLSLESFSGNALLFEPQAGSINGVGSIYCDQCNIRSHNNSAVAILSPHVNGIHFEDVHIEASGNHGIYLYAATKNFQIVGGYVSGNAAACSSCSGIEFRSGTFTNVQIVGVKIGQTDRMANTQSYAIGVDVGGGATAFVNMQLVGNDFTGNVNGPVAPNFLTSIFAGRVIRGNAGLITEAASSATISSGTSSVAITPGTTFPASVGDISIVAGGACGSGAYVSNLTSTSFTINTPAIVTSNCPFGWQVNTH